jgi:hypothetical protein
VRKEMPYMGRPVENFSHKMTNGRKTNRRRDQPRLDAENSCVVQSPKDHRKVLEIDAVCMGGGLPRRSPSPNCCFCHQTVTVLPHVRAVERILRSHDLHEPARQSPLRKGSFRPAYAGHFFERVDGLSAGPTFPHEPLPAGSDGRRGRYGAHRHNPPFTATNRSLLSFPTSFRGSVWSCRK